MNFEVLKKDNTKVTIKTSSQIVFPDDVIEVINSNLGIGQKRTHIEKLTYSNSIKAFLISVFYLSSIDEIYYKGTVEDYFQTKYGDSSSNPLTHGSRFFIDDGKGYHELEEVVIPSSLQRVSETNLAIFKFVKKIVFVRSDFNIFKTHYSVFDKKDLYFVMSKEEFFKNTSLSAFYANKEKRSKFYFLDEKGEYYLANSKEDKKVSKEKSENDFSINMGIKVIGLSLDYIFDLSKTSKKDFINTLKDSAHSIGNFCAYIFKHDQKEEIVAECKMKDIDSAFIEKALDNQVSLCLDDVIIDYLVLKKTCKPYSNSKIGITSCYAKTIIENNKLIDIEVVGNVTNPYIKPSLIIDIDKNIKEISSNSLIIDNQLVIIYQGMIKEFLHVKCDKYPLGTIVLCNDGVVEFIEADHEKAKNKLYYCYAHLGSPYLIAAKNDIAKKNFWGFIKNRHRAITSSNGLLSLSLYAYDYEDDDDNQSYYVLDKDNFEKIPYADVEAG